MNVTESDSDVFDGQQNLCSDATNETIVNSTINEENSMESKTSNTNNNNGDNSYVDIDTHITLSNANVIASDANAKESIAAQRCNDLEEKLNHIEYENVKLYEENAKLVKRLSETQLHATNAVNAVNAMNDTNAVNASNATNIANTNTNSNANIKQMSIAEQDMFIPLQNKIKTLHKDIVKMEEMKQHYRLNIEQLQQEVVKLRGSGGNSTSVHNAAVNRDRDSVMSAISGYCDKDLLYKLIVSQLFFDGHRDLALTLTNAEKMKQLCPPSDRLHNLVAFALKAEGDSPSLSDDSVHPTNLIDLDFEGDRSSLASRASLYDTGGKDFVRARSFSPDTDLSMLTESAVNLPSRMLDIGRMISKSSRHQDSCDAIQDINHVHSDSLSTRSTPELGLSSFSHNLRSLTPNVSESEMSVHSGLIPPSTQLDLTDLITQINLAQIAYFTPDPPSVASSSANTPSPTPLNSNVPLENGGLVLNEAAMKNLSQLAKMSANEVQNGLMPPSSTSPSSSLTPPIGRCSSTTGTKPNVMQIRCKFGQLGGQKGQFSSPHGFCLGVEEEIVIADTNNHRICIFDKSGDFKHSFGVPGKDEAQLWYPRKVAIIRTSSGHGTSASPRYVICDRGAERSRMQIFTRSGHFVRKIAIRYIDIVAGLAITPNGHIVAVDSVSPTVFVIAESGDLLRWFDCSEYMREPSDIAINNHEYYICDFKGHCVVVFNDEGQYMRKIGCEGLTSFPNGIDISDAGDILVGDSHGNRFHVVVFDRSGTLISEFECPYVKVSRCCGLKITSEGYVVTLAKNNHHVLILNTLYIM